MNSPVARCCNCNGESFVVESGYNTCISCGTVISTDLNENACSFDHTPTHSIRTTYTRIKRFKSKILGGLNRNLHHTIDQEIFSLLKERLDTRPVSPEQFLDHLSSLEIGRRKPYIHVVYYFEAIYKVRLPVIPQEELEKIANLFHEIFFANDRLKLERPTFPMATLLRLIVDNFEFSLKTQLVARFAKRLRCERRRRRYRLMFQKCCRFIANDARTREVFRNLRRKTSGADLAAGPEHNAPEFCLQTWKSLCDREGDAARREERDFRTPENHGY